MERAVKVFSFVIASIVAVCIAFGVTSLFTNNFAAKALGGKLAIDLPPNTKLMNVTWKETQLWYLTRPMQADEKAETLTFQEMSTLGILQGKVTFKESKEVEKN
jgi:hypothetical protein